MVKKSVSYTHLDVYKRQVLGHGVGGETKVAILKSLNTPMSPEREGQTTLLETLVRMFNTY